MILPLVLMVWNNRARVRMPRMRLLLPHLSRQVIYPALYTSYSIYPSYIPFTRYIHLTPIWPFSFLQLSLSSSLQCVKRSQYLLISIDHNIYPHTLAFDSPFNTHLSRLQCVKRSQYLPISWVCYSRGDLREGLGHRMYVTQLKLLTQQNHLLDNLFIFSLSW